MTPAPFPSPPTPTGPQCHFCHVKIPAPWIDKVASTQPTTDKEEELLSEHWMEEKSANSRLGCQVWKVERVEEAWVHPSISRFHWTS